MADLTPSATYGKTLLASPIVRAWSDSFDRKSGGAYAHDSREVSGQALYEIVSMLLALIDLSQSGALGLKVIHSESGTLAKGTLVRVTGYSLADGAYTVTPAVATWGPELARLVLAANLAPATVGQGFVAARIGNLDTSGFSAVGSLVYLSGSVAGAIAAAAGDVPQVVGRVTYKDASVGEVDFNIDYMQTVAALLDVDLSGISDGYMLVWNATQKRFQPAAPTDTDEKVKLDGDDPTAGYLADKIDNATIIANEGGTIQVGTIGNTQWDSEDPLDWANVDKTGAVASDVGAADADHEHSADDITSGSLAIGRAWLESLVELTGNPTLDSGAHAKTYYNATSTRKDPTLPSASAGLRVRFMVLHSDGIRIVAASGDRIRYGNDVTTADTGYVQSGANNGHVVELVAVDATNWVVVNAVGTWTLTAS